LAPGEQQRLLFTVPPGTGDVHCRLPADDLVFDNQALLLPPRQPLLEVANEVSDPRLHQLLQRALEASGQVKVGDQAGLVFSDRGERSPATPDEWVVRLLAEPEAAAFVGPFVLQNHPLTAGLSLAGVVWAAGRSQPFPGEPVITAGNVVLMSDSVDHRSRHLIRIRWRPERSTLQLTPDWPILISNLVSWRQLSLPGPDRSNLRLGEVVTVTLPAKARQLLVEAPDGERLTPAIIDRQGMVEATQSGRYTLRAGATTFAVAVHVAAAPESDLRSAVSGTWGSWAQATAQGRAADKPRRGFGQRSLSWLAALLALAAAVGHQALWITSTRQSS
ncbi:MAG: hypothetical protein GY831_27080, partial [Delftia sp.]|nr:hypothetical protein [Delftia sp.]